MIGILDPFSGVSGDMFLGALLDAGLDHEWLMALPARVGLPEVGVQISNVSRSSIACIKVDFEIPPQPHGRHLRQIREMVERAELPGAVTQKVMMVVEALTAAEARIHNTTVERVHLHEVGAVDAILDVVGAVWGLDELGVTRLYSGSVALGDGYVTAAHGLLPVPAPATLRILEGVPCHAGPAGSGELTTPTGAALVRILSQGAAPPYVPVKSGFGAGSRDPGGRVNAMRLILAEPAPAIGSIHPARGSTVRNLVVLAADIDDMTGEQLATCVDSLRADPDSLDVTVVPIQMKKGRVGFRIELLCEAPSADRLEGLLFQASSTIGVRRTEVLRRALEREAATVSVRGHEVQIKRSRLPDGSWRTKPESDDVVRVAAQLGIGCDVVHALALSAAQVGNDVGSSGVH